MHITEYAVIIARWHKIYGVPKFGAFRYDPTQVNACCAKCDHMRHRMARHHKANDFFFALNFPDLYARRYIEFRKEDVDKLCDPCHKSFHRYIRPLVVEMYEEFAIFQTRYTGEKESRDWCEEWRSKFAAKYTHWKKLKPKPRKRKKRRRKTRRISK